MKLYTFLLLALAAALCCMPASAVVKGPVQDTATAEGVEATQLVELLDEVNQFDATNPDLYFNFRKLFNFHGIPPASTAELRAILKVPEEEPLSLADLLVLAYTNQQRRMGGPDTDLKKNIENGAATGKHLRRPLYLEKETFNLDVSSYPNTLLPAFKETLTFTNTEIITGGIRVDLKQNYKVYLETYKTDANGAKRDAAALYEAMDGFGTATDTLFSILSKKTKGELDILKKSYYSYCMEKLPVTSNRARGPGKVARQNRCNLELRIQSDTSFGDEDRAMDMLASRPLKTSKQYYPVATRYNSVMKVLSKGWKTGVDFVDKHTLLAIDGRYGVGNHVFLAYSIQGLFYGIEKSIEGVEAWKLKSNKALETATGFSRFLWRVSQVTSTLVDALATPLHLLDRTATLEEIQSAIVDTLVLAVSFGWGKAASTVLRTGKGMVVASKAMHVLGNVQRVLIKLSSRVGKLIPDATKKVLLSGTKKLTKIDLAKWGNANKRSVDLAGNAHKLQATMTATKKQSDLLTAQIQKLALEGGEANIKKIAALQDDLQKLWVPFNTQANALHHTYKSISVEYVELAIPMVRKLIRGNAARLAAVSTSRALLEEKDELHKRLSLLESMKAQIEREDDEKIPNTFTFGNFF